MDNARADLKNHRLAALALAAAMVLGACSSGSGSDSGGSDGGAGTTAGSDPTTTAAPASGGGDLTGTWTADAGDIIGANTANLGDVSAPGLTCTGPVTLTFNDDETFSQDGSATCTMGAVSATATLNSTGTYAAGDGTVEILSSENSGTMEVAGQTQPLDGGFNTGEAGYEVDGDTLRITFTEASIGTITQTYAKS